MGKKTKKIPLCERCKNKIEYQRILGLNIIEVSCKKRPYSIDVDDIGEDCEFFEEKVG